MTTTEFHGVARPLKCQDFHRTVKKAAKEWYNNLASQCFSFFKDLPHAHMLSIISSLRARRRARPTSCPLPREMENHWGISSISSTLKSWKGLAKSLYIGFWKDFDDIMDREKAYRLANKALRSLDDRGHFQHRDKERSSIREGLSWDRKFDMPRTFPLLKMFALMNRIRSKKILYPKVEGYLNHLWPLTKSCPTDNNMNIYTLDIIEIQPWRWKLFWAQ